MVDDARLRTRVVRYLKDQNGEERSIEEIAEGTGLTVTDVRAGVDHNHFVDSLKPNLYYGVIQKIIKNDHTYFRYNKAQYLQNRSRWIDASGKRRGGGRGGEMTLPKPGNLFGWLKRGKGKE